jgi:hypothetical protein
LEILGHEVKVFPDRAAAFRFAAGFFVELGQLKVGVRAGRIQLDTSL